MAVPRVFVSSTYYDLRQIRADLELFIREMGYEPILHESGGVAYGSAEKLEEYAYKEVALADLLVSVVGGRYGTQSQHGGRSISQEELKRALDNGTQVYIFVEQSVWAEFQTWRANKDVPQINWRFVDDPRIYEYLDGLYALPNNNAIQGFETAADITGFLKLQWAGLFHRYLQDQSKRREIRALEEMQATVRTLDRLVDFLTHERRDQDEAIRDILRVNHPLFSRLRQLFNIRYPVFFRDLSELNRWLVDAQGFKPIPSEHWDDEDHYEWQRGNQYLKVRRDLFDDRRRLKPIEPADWNDEWALLLPIYDPETDYSDEGAYISIIDPSDPPDVVSLDEVSPPRPARRRSSSARPTVRRSPPASRDDDREKDDD
jgi:hypothetical protein